MSGGRNRFAFDLDGTLCHTDGGDYEHAEPMMDRIAVVNRLHQDGHFIIIHTARGDLSTLEQSKKIMELTRAQLEEWGVHYDQLRMKVFADVYVDDRAVVADHFFFFNEHRGKDHG